MVTTVQLTENGSVDHKKVVYKLGDQPPPLATEKVEQIITSQDCDRSDIVLVESGEFLEEDHADCSSKEQEFGLDKVTCYQQLDIVDDEGALVFDNDLPSPPISVCEELHKEDTGELSPFPLTHSAIPENCIKSELSSNNQPEAIPEYCTDIKIGQIVGETLDTISDHYLVEPTNFYSDPIPSTKNFTEEDAENSLEEPTEEQLNSQSVDYLEKNIDIEVRVDQQNDVTSIFELKGKTNTEKESTESLDFQEESISSLNPENEATEPSYVEKESPTLSTSEKQIDKSSDLDEEITNPVYTEKATNVPGKSENFQTFLPSVEISNSLTSTEFCPEEEVVVVDEHGRNISSTVDAELLDETHSSALSAQSVTSSILTDSPNHLTDTNYRNSLASSEVVPSKHTLSIDSLSESVNNTTNTSNNNDNLKELTLNTLNCDTSMSTTVGVSDITADQSEINRESYISYPSYEIDNTPSQSSFGHLNHLNHDEYQTRLNGGEGEYLPGDIKENISGNNNSNEDIPTNDDRSEYTNMKTEESYHDSTCPSHSEQELDQDILKNEHGKNELIPEQNMECLNIQNVENQQKLSFNQIKEDLEKKNVIGSLQPLRPEQYIMHHQAGLIKQQEMLVLNPQTGDVLSDQYSSHHQTNTITTGGTHHFARNITSTNSVVVPSGGNVSGPPVGSGTVAGQQKGSTIYPKTGQNPIDGGTNGGVGANSSGSAGGGPSKSGTLVGGGLDRSRQVYNMFECQMSQLTVFLDRALICRRIRPRFNASDITEVVFEHLSPAIDKDSIRVEIRGAATILDVSFSAKSLSGEEDTWSQCVNELLVELRQCRRRADNLVNRIIRTEKQRCVLETFADSLSRREDEILLGGSHYGHTTLNNIPNHTGVVDQVNNISSQGATLSGGTTPANAQMAATTAEHKCINDMLVSYVVNRCGWKPAYDIRIFNNDGTMKIVYYGMVQQATGEDWETRYMTLSTAQPGIGGTVPHLGIQRVHFRRDHSPAIPISRNAISSTSVTTGYSSGGMTSTTTIPASTGHQISGASSTGKNTRSCTKLGAFKRSNRTPGTNINEIDRVGSMDNESEIRAVAPGEEFNCHLGAENGIKILYRPLFKYREGTGSSGKNATMTFKQLIEVRNTFDRRVRLMVVDQVPVSAEDKIKVNLLEPTIKHPEKYDKNRPIRMNKFNNVEWDLDLGPDELEKTFRQHTMTKLDAFLL
ncbi:hypothetical protein Smp_139100.2 [Schistosoma mansoni]|uniref:hypothetical protein n=1 Tax=Schistosoma mansoni TaxID=6183 RepID=UPI00022DC7AB|nr:hypothetical protein Smp_139100.2 [Schistosoma mansoni]|eukprot:XP_018653926.1 hypothetical protein Smp_139100.2 [Schistosoma mansoni]